MLDILVGTIDRADLEKDYMRPERQLWCNRGVPWIRDMATNGAKSVDGGEVPRHPLTKIDKISERDNVSADEKQLSGMGKSFNEF